jgi:hypothetical protein
LFACTIAGTISVQIFAAIVSGLPQVVIDDKGNKDVADPSMYGYILFGFVAFSYLGSCPFFYLAGKHYRSFKLEELRVKEEEEAQALMEN